MVAQVASSICLLLERLRTVAIGPLSLALIGARSLLLGLPVGMYYLIWAHHVALPTLLAVSSQPYLSTHKSGDPSDCSEQALSTQIPMPQNVNLPWV